MSKDDISSRQMGDGRKSGGRGGSKPVYTPALAFEICRRIADGESLEAICKTPGFPTPSSVRYWSLADFDGFRDLFQHARELRAELLLEEIITIADDTSGDLIMTANGPVPNPANVARARLEVDTRKWLAAKVLPKVYGTGAQTASANEPASSDHDPAKHARQTEEFLAFVRSRANTAVPRSTIELSDKLASDS